MNLAELNRLLAKFRTLRVAVLGDFCVDRYFDVDARLARDRSKETGLPIHQVARVRTYPGGSGTVLHWDGTSWSPVPSGESDGIAGVWASSRTAAWAVGDVGVILRWNGAVWLPVASGTTEDLLDVWGASAAQVWAVGQNGTLLRWRE